MAREALRVLQGGRPRSPVNRPERPQTCASLRLLGPGGTTDAPAASHHPVPAALAPLGVDWDPAA